ncbi:MAG: hypothetical protein A3F74_25045 [Betaproteobacteria bacterium RIFCSPLOWO2_12_FULL_62_58]|nr:MAG: hypothetical protein A3F74_25045 [Betaproteobacteria bacterium RIFCSPLOWO2_12_FULL_62_58]
MFERTACLALAATLALLAPAAAGAEQAGEVRPGFKLSGYYKNILARSETVLPAKERYTADLNRLRLELKGNLADGAALDLQYDNEILLGSYLHTAQFGLQKDQPSPQYWNLESNYSEAGSYYARHRLYRASVTLASGDTDVRIGRQRIAWGTGRFWSPLDMLNPFSPIQLEREERLGVDAVLVERKLGALSRLGAVYAPQHASRDSSAAAQWHGNRSGVDFSLVGGKFRRDHMVGIDLAGQIGSAGVRGELTSTRPETGASYRRAVAGLDYAFPNTLNLTAELYYNGGGASDRQAYDFASLFAGRIQNVGRRYVGLFAGYEITPLLKWNNYFVGNLADHSSYFSPSLTYSMKTSLDWTVGVQLFRGSNGSEYGRFNDVYYTQLQWFF